MLENLKIKTKILSAVILLGIISLGGLTYLAAQYRQSAQNYSRFVQNEAQAGMAGARAAAGVWTSVAWGLRLINLEPGTPAFVAGEKTFNENYAGARDRLSGIPAMVPARQSAIADLIATMDQLKAAQDDVVEAVKAGDKDAVARLTIKMDEVLATLSPKFGANNKAMNALISEGDAALSAATTSTIYLTSIALVLGILLALAFAIYVAQVGITSPVMKLRQRMESLAGGQTSDAIPGTSRRDEIGQMAAAVAVFRDNAVERNRLEAQTAGDRSRSEEERAQRERQKQAESTSLQQAVESLGNGLGQLASGDLACRIETPFVAHLDTLRQDFNNSVAKLAEAMQAVGTNARAIGAGADEIRSAADDLSRRTEQQAASVEETAAALEEITTTVKDAAKRAGEASTLVSRTRQSAEKSAEIVRSAVNAMQQIEKSSSEISNIIGVIDDIAFQTNLLALNAGVEAARAGEAGKGFAVVAQEVRELAQRSAKAAKEIKALINTSGTQVLAGVELVGETGTALEEIARQVQEINLHVHAIADSAREQSLGLSEINTAVNTMDQGTQQNAAMVEQTTAASHSLAGESSALIGLLSQFKFAAGAGQVAPVARTAAPANRPIAPVKASVPRAATASARPAPSPARALGNKLASAFGGTSTASKEPDWAEF